jgi:DNA-binding NarL/FixJ family response regulator
MLRVALLDRHPPMLDDLRALLEIEPDVAVTSLLTAPALGRRLPELRPHVVVLAGADALAVCGELTSLPAPPAAIVVAARVEPELVLAARAAGAEAVLAAEDGAFGMLATIHAAAAGEATLPLVGRAAHPGSLERLADDDLPVLTMLLDGRHPTAIAATLGIAPHEIDRRVRRIVAGLQPAA